MQNEKNQQPLTFTFDPSDFQGMLRLMDEKGDSDTMFLGENDEAEDTTISIFRDKIVYVTYQNNGWVRRNIYYRDGSSEELYDGRWNN